jgi:iron complex outermembrane receptor protein
MKTALNKVAGKVRLGLLASATVTSFATPTALAQDAKAEKTEAAEQIIVTGTRLSGRSAADSPVPVDVISGEDFRQNSSTDVQDLLRTAVPSFNVNTQPISDAATIVRPANVRGLSPDNVLVLVNGKRRHRGSIISFLGGGISDGAQGVDISSIPSLALKQVEVLRDGASSQYGSDAIAGVLNFILRDDAEGFEVVARAGSTTEGDGDSITVSANAGFALGDDGFINITGEFREVDGTVRSVVRDDVAGLVAAGYLSTDNFIDINSYTNEVPQYWGQPDVKDDVKIFINSAYSINDNAELYLFGNYGERNVAGGFFYRNPVTEGSQRGGVYAGPIVDPLTGLEVADGEDGVHSILVGDLDGLGVGGECIDGIPIGGTGNVTPDPDFLAEVTADANCFSFVETIPFGFTPRFGGDNTDRSIALGVRGEIELGTGLLYDASVQYGSNETIFFINNTINASLGPATPRDFVPGGQIQEETVANLDLVYAVDVGFASDLNIGFGTEYREETFELFQGDDASFELGVLADQGFSSSSNGFGGFPADTASSQDSVAFYVDVEADVIDNLTLQAAVRYEDFSTFGDTTNFKIAGIYKIIDEFRIRAAYSTGFHAPTAGQASITNVTTAIVNGSLVDQGTLPLSSPAGQLAADFVESSGNGRPTLGPEDAKNFSLGFSLDVAGMNWTVDYYNIKLEDRVALGANVDFLAALEFVGGVEYGSVPDGLIDLDARGIINRSDFIGLDDLTEFRFFSNSFDTTTWGFDVVGNYSFDLMGGDSKLIFTGNYNETSVDSVGTVNPIDADRVAAIEDLLPNTKWNLAWTHQQGNFRTLLRANYFGGWDDTGNGVNGISAEVLIDVQVSYFIGDNWEVAAGVDNLFDTFPDRNPFAGNTGQLFPENSPFGFNGSTWYLQGRYQF